MKIVDDFVKRLKAQNHGIPLSVVNESPIVDRFINAIFSTEDASGHKHDDAGLFTGGGGSEGKSGHEDIAKRSRKKEERHKIADALHDQFDSLDKEYEDSELEAKKMAAKRAITALYRGEHYGERLSAKQYVETHSRVLELITELKTANEAA